jgi:hypothetical protein
MVADMLDNGVLVGELLDGDSQDFRENSLPMQQVKTAYTTAVAVQRPRNLLTVHKSLEREAALAGESFYYGWGNGNDKIEGPSIKLAMAAARCYGNSAVDMLPVQDMEDSWIMTAVFVDLETGFTLTRQFRQSKNSKIHGKHDAERKDDMRFQIGQSKAVRNVVVNAVPEFLIDAAITAAKSGVRKKIEEFVKSKGLPAAVEMVANGLKKHGVQNQNILDKCQVADIKGITVDHIVMLRGDLYALDNGQEYATTLFPTMESKSGNKAKSSELNKQVGAPPWDIIGNKETTDADARKLYDEYCGPDSDAPNEIRDRVSEAWNKRTGKSPKEQGDGLFK